MRFEEEKILILFLDKYSFNVRNIITEINRYKILYSSAQKFFYEKDTNDEKKLVINFDEYLFFSICLIPLIKTINIVI